MPYSSKWGQQEKDIKKSKGKAIPVTGLGGP
jgi:hypothetical protein